MRCSGCSPRGSAPTQNHNRFIGVNNFPRSITRSMWGGTQTGGKNVEPPRNHRRTHLCLAQPFPDAWTRVRELLQLARIRVMTRTPRLAQVIAYRPRGSFDDDRSYIYYETVVSSDCLGFPILVILRQRLDGRRQTEFPSREVIMTG